MRNSIQNIDVVMDKRTVSKELVKRYQLEDEVKNGCSRFVGIIYKDTDKGVNILVSLPFNYMNVKEFQSRNIKERFSNIQTILTSILKYNRTQGLVGLDDFHCSFPINAYNQVYTFYQKYGLYRENITNIKQGQNGNIDWKSTFRKSNSFINTKTNTIVYFPFYQKEKIVTNNLITECMAFVLNYTKEYFKDILQLPISAELESFGVNYSLLNNKDYVVQQLKEELSHTYKDYLRNLITNLIRFFEKLETNYSYDFSMIQFEFHNVWEHAVNEFLTNHFIGVDEDKTLFKFTNEKIEKFFFQKDSRSYDLVNANNRLEPDHYYYDKKNNVQYIFDSKYMEKLNGLNHKQLIYGILYSKGIEKTFNTLVLPGLPSINKNSVQGTKHVEVKKNLLPDSINELIVYQIKINEKFVLESFIN
ncbi:LlaJI family restriction endonuclease [Ligilactobacillus aviarius]|uniref:LlaJI family restriction endonuclease n=1 Tax=Ligilactobacillus aviarius TaxID=1606 RepID=A0A179C6P0_9LACO|nr:LlaJI family restriction endonuclease [Ligilactobacillus aviarius]OAP97390.1 hypothetical protein A3O07_00845 [Ligilactobacillus aviarius]OAQ00939.1 hypothetical protein A3O09_03985 [Ligilactobacillus aviarius]OAQ01204.1 hypothetical protein A3O08_02870 [Ligilactobacillus aviarius]OAQ06042.1 hypothetical protein A3O13_01935 [Ligilactobacillus aviarius]OAQ08739.1 hypothetical protein A3O14_03385 [Ligilactobacillus aviarius]